MSEYYAVQRSTDHLAHYGVKGMKWGVRKAIATGNQRALDRHFRKAAKKLKKLQDIGLRSGKYAAKATAYGAAAAGAGTLAVGGTKMTGKAISGLGNTIEGVAHNAMNSRKYPGKHATAAFSFVRRVGGLTKKAGNKLQEWGKPNMGPVDSSKVNLNNPTSWKNAKLVNKNKNDLYFRIGAGAVAAGLGAKAAQNAYRAANGKKYREKASRFKTAMDDAFGGTKYEGQYIALPKTRKRRRK